MSASYPASVRTFSLKQDATMFVLAAHVNDLQDEVAAVERTLGTIPHEWDSGSIVVKTYATVKDRLDDAQNTVAVMQGQIASIITQLQAIGPLSQRVTNLESQVSNLNSQVSAINATLTGMRAQLNSHESRITNLENSTSGLPGAITRLQQQMASLQAGEAASILNTGQAIVPDNYAWRILNWNGFEYDNVGIYTGGSSLFCPQDGWWLINVMFLIPNKSGGGTGVETISNLELRINGNGVASSSEQLELGIGGFHRLNVTWAGAWYRGSTAQAAVNMNPYPGSAPSGFGRISFTRLHGL
jgi:chaperonin cofactor prefoldin